MFTEGPLSTPSFLSPRHEQVSRLPPIQVTNSYVSRVEYQKNCCCGGGGAAERWLSG